MGWLSNLWANITQYIANFIRNCLLQLTKWIDDARVAIAKFKYKLRMTIAGWIADDQSLLLLSFAVIVTVVLAVIIGNMPFIAKLITAYTTMKENFKNRTGSIAGIFAFQVALATHRIALIFFADYQKMIQDLHASISAFMDVIGEPVRTASLLLENARTLVYSGYILAGRGEDYSEAQWISSTQDWVNNLGNRIERYTRNPEMIMQDIWIEVVQPNLQEPQETVSTLYRTVHNISNNIITFTDNLDNFRNRLDDFIAVIPDDVREAIDTRLLPITDKLDFILDEKLIPFTEKTEAVFNVIDQLIIDNENKIVEIAIKTDDPLYLLELIDKLSGDRKEHALRLLELLTKEKELSAHKKYASVVDMEFDDYKKRLEIELEKPIESKVPAIILPSTPILIGQIKYTKESWFVGEH